MTTWGRRAVCFGLVVMNLGCSVINMRLPPSDPVMRAQTPGNCKKIWPPVLDTGLALSGIITVVHANSELEGELVGYYSDGSEARIKPTGSDETAYKALRGVGYAQMAVFGLSAIYGFIIHAKCPSVQGAPKPESAPTSAASAQRAPFPGSVYAFRFDMTEASAAQACASGGQAWKLENSIGLCKAASASQADVRVTYRFGAVHEIAAIYRTQPQQLGAAYDNMYGAMSGRYGVPEVDRAPLSAACTASLAECLANGERPGGAVWRWTAGTIELVPIFSDGQPQLELRHTREEAMAH